MSSRLKTLGGKTQLLGQGVPQQFPIQLDPAPFEGAMVYTTTGEIRYSNGIDWLEISGAQGTTGIQGAQGTQGVQGDYGPGFTIIGSVADVDTTGDPDAYLQTQFPTATIGEGVIDETDQELWIWDGTNWINIGSFRGEQGLQGVQGNQGVQGAIGYEGIQGERGYRGFQGIQGIQGVQGVQGDLGFQGTQGYRGVQGFRGIQGDLGIQGAIGFQGLQGIQGPQAFQGVQGLQGLQGFTGVNSGLTLEYRQLIDVVESDPGTGNFILNNNDLSLSTRMWIDDEQINDVDVQGFLRALDEPDSENKAFIKITLLSNPSKFAFFSIQEVTEEIGYFEFEITYIDGSAVKSDFVEIIGPTTYMYPVALSFSLSGDQGIQGEQGFQGSQGTQGIQGLQGVQGLQGFIGSQGVQGLQGLQGYTGEYGGVTFEYTYNQTDITNSDPTAGFLKGNNAVLGDATQLYIDVEDRDSVVINDLLAGFYASTNPTNKGYLKLSDASDAYTYALFEVTSGSLVGDAATGYHTINVTSLVAGQSFPNNSDFRISFIRTGDQGVQGTQGIQGMQGSQGVQGGQGTQGVQGSQGVQGVQGFQGLQGVQGSQGPQGTQGIQGTQGFQGVQGVQGPQGLQGLQGVQGVQGFQGLQGVQGLQGPQGTTGIQGLQGLQGLQGHTGDHGGITYEFLFDDDRDTDVAPTARSWKIDSNDISTATTLAIDDIPNNQYSNQLDELYDWLDAIDGPRKFTMVIESSADNDGPAGHHFVIYEVSDVTWDSVSKNWAKFSVSYIASGAVPLDNWDNVLSDHGPDTVITFVPSGNTGAQGVQGMQGLQGLQGVQGLQGPQGPQGVQGTQGFQGVQGLQGTTGIFGGLSFEFTFNPATDTFPANTGEVKVNNSNLTIGDRITISDDDRNGTDIQGILNSIDVGTNPVKGFIRIVEQDDVTKYATYEISDLQEGLGSWAIFVTYLSGSATSADFTTDSNVIVTFSKAGNIGERGPQGVQGMQGFQGLQGLQGLQGAQGLQGLQGLQGSQGVQGIEGSRDYAVSNNGNSDWIVDGVSGNPTLRLLRGFSYVFTVAATGHPFFIKTDPGTGTGDRYDDGVSGQGVENGKLFFRVPSDAPDTLYYQCSNHTAMVGILSISDLGPIGPQGPQGTQGVQGIQGGPGTFGGLTFEYNYSDSTTDSDPGVGNVRFDNSTLSSATGLYIDDRDINFTSLEAFFRSTGEPLSAVKGHIVVTDKAQPSLFAVYEFSDVAEKSGYFDFTLNYTSGSVSGFDDGDGLIISFTRTGDRGFQGIQGFQGTQGVQGTQGFQGLQGERGTGAQGATGSQGIQGNLGVQGLQGTQGIQGSQGPQGVQGERGFQGESGFVGALGAQGIQGVQGERGFQGVQGTTGDAGLDGQPGDTGADGPQGIQGIQGTQGFRGEEGEGGEQGLQGERGFQGIQGIAGVDGVLGSQGTQGIQGVQGGSGNTGIQGGLGFQGTQGLQGGRGTGAQGVQGNQGFQGIQGGPGVGADGPQGTQGLQGIQGNLGFQGEIGEGIQGPLGFQGVQGTRGAGDPGVQGVQGVQGPLGIQGVPGAGLQGETGAQGVQGTQGFQGLTGEGAPGAQGEAGPQGPIGLQGPDGGGGAQGATGPQGVQGDLGFQGAAGAGEQGLQGIQGIQGPFGAQGIAGNDGNGIQGARGPQGTAGENGDQGLQGPIGEGSQGARGFQGFTGESGGLGVQGYRGFQGAQGSAGSDGVGGTQGPRGFQGAQGIDGANGIDGQDGAIGPQGTTGIQGNYGIQGFTGIQGSAGALGVDGVDGEDGAQGPAGPQGADGIQGLIGPQGADGGGGDAGEIDVENIYLTSLQSTAMFIPFIEAGSGPRQLYGTTGPNPGGEANFIYTATNDELTVENLQVEGNLNVVGTITGNSLGGFDGTAVNIQSANSFRFNDSIPLYFGTDEDITISWDNTSGELRFDPLASTDSFRFRNAAGTDIFSIFPEDNGASWDAGVVMGGDLFASGDIIAGGDFNSLSDARVKENVYTIDSALDKVNNLRGVYYNKIGEEDRKVGVIAQEVEEILPELVREDKEGIKSVAYANMVSVLIEAVKELSAEVEKLKKL